VTVVAGGRPVFGPESYFLLIGFGTLGATIHAAGTFLHPYVLFMGWGLVAFLLGVLSFSRWADFDHKEELRAFCERPFDRHLGRRQRDALLALGILSLLVTVAYFLLLGSFAPLAAALSFLESGAEGMMRTYNEVRRSSSATGRYLAPGYVAQFKNCLLPLITLVLFFEQRGNSRSQGRWLLRLFLLATILGLVGTGARFGLAFFGASLLALGVAPFMGPSRLRPRSVLLIGVAALLGLTAMTLMMGARGQKTLGVPVLWAPVQVIDRVFVSPSHERFRIYEEFLDRQPPQWGRGALRELENILPGRAQYTLTNRFHEMLYGSPNGNVSLDFWGSIWYDYRWWGLGVAYLLGVGMHAFYIWMIRGSRTIYRMTILGYAGIVLGLSTDLQVLILRGFVTSLALLWLLEMVARLSVVRSRAAMRADRLPA
jgi:hypothetical protein